MLSFQIIYIRFIERSALIWGFYTNKKHGVYHQNTNCCRSSSIYFCVI